MQLAFRSLLMLFVLSAATFFLIATMPDDPVAIALRAWNLPSTPDIVSMYRQQWGLDIPALPRYFRWLAHFAAGDWGVSYRTGEPVRSEVLLRLPLSLGLGLGGLTLAIAAAVPLGFLSALAPGGVTDRFTRALAILAQSAPSFFLGLIAIWVLAVKLHLMRPFGGNGASIALAVALISIHSIGVLSRVYRRGLVEVAQEPFMQTARAKGLSEAAALWRHGQRHALFALLSAARSEAAWAVGTSAMMEVLFGLPGISAFLVDSIAARDYGVLQAYVMIVAVWLLSLNGLVATLISWLDPRSA